MQSTGQTSTHAVSLVSMQGSVMMKGMLGSLRNYDRSSPAGAGARSSVRFLPDQRIGELYIAAYSRQTTAQYIIGCGSNYTRHMSIQTETPERARRGPEPPDISEKGGPKNGQPQ